MAGAVFPRGRPLIKRAKAYVGLHDSGREMPEELDDLTIRNHDSLNSTYTAVSSALQISRGLDRASLVITS